MNPRFRFLLARFVCVFTFLLVIGPCSTVSAQPQYSAFPNLLNNTDYPLNSYVNKAQWIHQPNQFYTAGSSSNASAPYGKIKTLYIQLGNEVDNRNTYTDFTIKLGQPRDTISSWSSLSWDTTLQTVVKFKELKITEKKFGWLSFDLQNAFMYDPSKSLLVELSVTSGKGSKLVFTYTGKNTTALFGQSSGAQALQSENRICNIGFDLEAWKSDNAGVSNLIAPRTFCDTIQDIWVELINNGNNLIDSVQVNWSLNGTQKTPFWYTTSIDTFGSIKGNTVTIKLGTDTFPSGSQKRLVVWTKSPNGRTDSVSMDDTLTVVIRRAMKGDYTLGDTSADYQNLNTLSRDLNELGVCGPVTITIDTGTYTGRLVLGKILGTNASDTILIRGKNVMECIVENDASSTADQQNILLNSCSYVTLKNLTINVLDTTIGVGIQLINTSNVNVDNCHINMVTSTIASNLYGIAGIGSRYNIKAKGFAGHNNTFTNNLIVGGNTAMSFSGEGYNLLSNGITISNNDLTKFKDKSMVLKFTRNIKVERNRISGRHNFYPTGIESEKSNNIFINANHIEDTYFGIACVDINTVHFSDSVPSVITNNMIYSTKKSNIGMYIARVNKLNVYHNSISSAGTYTAIFTGVDSTNIKNNIFHHSKGGLVFVNTDSNGFNGSNTVDYNNYFSQNTNNAYTVLYGTKKYTKITNWFKSDTMINQSAFNQVPGFKSANDLHIDSTGDLNGSDLQITHDFDGDIRCSAFPTIGADQFIPGIHADVLKPDKICRTGCLTYTLPNINRYPNSTYGTDWRFDSIRISTSSGYTHSKFKLTNPSISRGGTISFCPDSTELDSLFKVFLVYQDLNVTSCYATFTAYVLVTDLPDATFTISEKELCYGDTLLVKSAGSHLDDSVIFVMGDGYKKADATFHYLYDDYGSYTIKKYVASNGCADSSQLNVSVGGVLGSKLVAAHFNQGKTRTGRLRDPDYICTSDTTYYQVFPPKTIHKFMYDSLWKMKWVSLSTLGGAQVSDTLTILPDSFNSYRIGVFPGDQYLGDTLILQARITSLIHNNCDTTLYRYITLRTSPKVGFTTTKICKGETITVVDTTDVNANIVDRFWNFHDGYTSTEVTDTHTYHNVGWQRISLANLSKNGCHGYAEARVKINPRSDVRFISHDSCENETIRFQDTSLTYGSNHTYTWLFSDGSIKTGRQVLHTFDTAGSYQTTLFVTDSMGCVDSTTQATLVLLKPKADFLTYDSCLNLIVRFRNTSADTVGPTYSWLFTEQDTSYDLHLTFKFSQLPLKPIRLIVANSNGCSDTALKHIALDSVPIISFVHQVLSTYTVRYVPSDSTGLVFKWYFGDGDSSLETSPTHTYPSVLAHYNVTCIVSTKKGCTASASDSVKLGNQSISFVPTTNITAHPNPFSDAITIKIHGETETIKQVQIVSVLGQTRQLSFNNTGNELLITDLGNMSPGVYALQLHTDSEIYQIKMLKTE